MRGWNVLYVAGMVAVFSAGCADHDAMMARMNNQQIKIIDALSEWSDAMSEERRHVGAQNAETMREALGVLRDIGADDGGSGVTVNCEKGVRMASAIQEGNTTHVLSCH